MAGCTLSIFCTTKLQRLHNRAHNHRSLRRQLKFNKDPKTVEFIQSRSPVKATEAPQISILSQLNNFEDTASPYDKTATPMFWHIPKAGGSSMRDLMGACHRFVQATERGVADGHIFDTEIAVVYPTVPGAPEIALSPFVNIDSSTVAGIQRAKSLGFADSHLADVVISPLLFPVNDLFTQTSTGRLFSVFRNPIDRAVSMFYYIQIAYWEPTYHPDLKDWTLEQYATSDIVENNWMTRYLSNQLGGELTEENLQQAMNVVKTKFLVGLMTKIEESMSRFEKFFRWTYHVNPWVQEECRERLMSGGSNSNKANKKPLAERGLAGLCWRNKTTLIYSCMHLSRSCLKIKGHL